MELTRELARFIADSRCSDIPASILHEAKRAILNWTACALGGCRDEAVNRIISALSEFAGPPHATLLGRRERVDALHAALINAVSSNILDFDDTHLKTVIHPTVPVASALLAAVECSPASGARFLHAFVIGVETECRIGNAISPAHYDHGWQITSTCGVFGAAAAVGKLYGLSEQQMVWALGIAATQSSGLLAMIGSMGKSYNMGHAARNGLASALLAAKGFSSSERALEAPRGFFNVLAENADATAVIAGLGASWELAANAYKPFPCGIVVHPVIDACLQLRNEHTLAPEEIEHIAITAHPLVLDLTGNKTPHTGLEAKLSVYHSAAVSFLYGAAGIPQYSDECACAPAVMAMRARVTVKVDPSVPREAAYVRVGLKDGRMFNKNVLHAIGTLERPMSDADIETKFKDLAAGSLSPCHAQDAINLIWTFDMLDDAGQLAHAVVPKSMTSATPMFSGRPH